MLALAILWSLVVPAAAATAAMPSGRTSYRTLADYGGELTALANAHPDIARPITLPLTSRLGRPVVGIEIATEPNARDGRPVLLQLGLHHANEWPSGEHAMEWAYELINAFRAGDARTRSLVAAARTVIVPVVNPDGFNFSREAAPGSSAEQHRKNCTPAGCFVSQGVDVNRNYGDLWGGPGAPSNPTSNNYRGTAPFSEPEAENIRRFISGRQVVMLITNHTAGRLILRQPGSTSDTNTPDEPLLRQVGASMATENGYSNIFSHDIGDHVGTTDGWSYNTTGGLAYVFESQTAAHPAYEEVIQDYDGSQVTGGGNREAFYVAMQSAANPAHHAVLRGSAPPGAILRLTKSFMNRVSTGPMTSERFDTTMEVPASGAFEWHVNQSSRPRVPGETWTLICERPEGSAFHTQQIAVARGQALDLGAAACAPRPEVGVTLPEDVRRRVTVTLTLVAGLRGSVYRARVSGALRGVGDFERCDGVVALSLVARQKPLGSKRAGLDERCRFTRLIKFRLGDLPKPIRKLGARRGFARPPPGGGTTPSRPRRSRPPGASRCGARRPSPRARRSPPRAPRRGSPGCSPGRASGARA